MLLNRGLLAALLLGGLAGCGDATSEGGVPGGSLSRYPYAFAVPDCAPWDGAAVSVYFSNRLSDQVPPLLPLVRVSVYRDIGALTIGSLSWNGDSQLAGGSRCDAASNCETALTGRLDILSLTPQALTGTLDLSFADGSRLHGGFRARLIPRRTVCG